MEDIVMRKKKSNEYMFYMYSFNDDIADKDFQNYFCIYKNEDEALARMKAEYFVQKERYESQGDAISESCLKPEGRYAWLSTESGIHIEMSVIEAA